MATSIIPELIPERLRHGEDTIPPLDPNITLSTEDAHRKALHEALQSWKLKDFTIAQMTDYGCWDKPDAKPNNLTTPIHPLYQLGMWCGNGLAQIGGGYEGKWVMKNPVVWKAMEPVLGLASLLLARATQNAFLDALLMNPWTKVSDSEVQDGCRVGKPISQAYSFHPRHPNVVSSMTSKRQEWLNELTRYVRYGIDPAKNAQNNNIFIFGYHQPICSNMGPNPQDQRYKQSMIWLTSEIILPLLGPLKTSERLVQEFGVAKTHLIGVFSAHLQRLPYRSSEPFFTNDAISEVGRAWECSVFEGWVQGTIRDPPPFLGCQLVSWPSWEGYGEGKYNPNIQFCTWYRNTTDFQAGGVRGSTIHGLIQLTYFESLQQSAFWNTYLPRFGDQVFILRMIVGNKAVRGGRSCLAVDNGQVRPEPQTPQNADEGVIWAIEQQRIVRAAAIKEAARREAARREKEAKKLALAADVEKQFPWLKAQQTQKDRQEEEQEWKLLDLAFAAYHPEAEDSSAKLYQALKTSRFARVRAEYFFCYGEFETGGDRNWRDRMKRLGRQEWLLLDRNDPFFQRCSDRRDQILAMKQASRGKGEAEKERREAEETDAMDTGP